MILRPLRKLQTFLPHEYKTLYGISLSIASILQGGDKPELFYVAFQHFCHFKLERAHQWSGAEMDVASERQRQISDTLSEAYDSRHASYIQSNFSMLVQHLPSYCDGLADYLYEDYLLPPSLFDDNNESKPSKTRKILREIQKGPREAYEKLKKFCQLKENKPLLERVYLTLGKMARCVMGERMLRSEISLVKKEWIYVLQPKTTCGAGRSFFCFCSYYASVLAGQCCCVCWFKHKAQTQCPMQ